ncbi:MAG TPA: hypothetical protein VE439_02230, partial [Anaerolineae bacterium]|nr:hypothetical protein [Anaerolineae bacterium]
KKSSYVAAIIINIVLLLIFNNLLNWHVPFITRSFLIPLRILNISITATIIANLVFLVYDPAWFLALTRTVLNIIGLVFVYTLFIVFPFDFSSLTSEGLIVTLVKIVLIIGIFGTAVAVIIEFSRFVRALARI